MQTRMWTNGLVTAGAAQPAMLVSLLVMARPPAALPSSVRPWHGAGLGGPAPFATLTSPSTAGKVA
jgi:hypothetical protein